MEGFIVLRRIKNLRKLMWVARVLASIKFVSAVVFFLALSQNVLGLSAAVLAIGSVYASIGFQERATVLEEERERLWRYKHRTPERIRPLIKEQCRGLLVPEERVLILDPLLELGPGPYSQEDINKIVGDNSEQWRLGLFHLIMAGLLYQGPDLGPYRWSERLWERVDRKTPTVPEKWEPEGSHKLLWPAMLGVRIG